jgi:hypothetical protein
LQRSVLVLDQSSIGLPFNTALAAAVRLTLNAQSAVPISFFLENLDANRFYGSGYEDDILSFFKRNIATGTLMSSLSSDQQRSTSFCAGVRRCGQAYP